MSSHPGAEDLDVVTRFLKAVDEGDERACSALLAEDVTYTFVSQGEYRGRPEVAQTVLGEGATISLNRDLFTADGSGRVWWRYSAQWTDAETGRPRKTTGASVAHVEGALVRSLMSWVDVLGAGVDAT